MGLLLVSEGFVWSQIPLNRGKEHDLINAGLGMSTRGLPFFVGIEQSIDEFISAGAIASFQSYRERGSEGDWIHQYYGLGVQGNYHFKDWTPPDFDLFAGLTLGWYAHRFRWAGAPPTPGNYDGSAIGGLQLAGQLGARYTYKDVQFLAQLNGGSLLSGFLVGLSFPL